MAAPSPTLEQLVKDEVHELVRRLVREVIAEELNGYAGEPAESAGNGSGEPRKATTGANRPPDTPEPHTALERRCSMCGELKPPSEFGKGRAQCRACRSATEGRRQRERKAKASDDGEQPGLAGS